MGWVAIMASFCCKIRLLVLVGEKENLGVVRPRCSLLLCQSTAPFRPKCKNLVEFKCWFVSGSRRRRRRPMRQSGETFMRSLSVAGACNTMCTWLRVTNTTCTCALHTGGIGSLSAVSHGRRIPQPRATRQPLSPLFIGSPPPGESRARSSLPGQSHTTALSLFAESIKLTITNTTWWKMSSP